MNELERKQIERENLDKIIKGKLENITKEDKIAILKYLREYFIDLEQREVEIQNYIKAGLLSNSYELNNIIANKDKINLITSKMLENLSENEKEFILDLLRNSLSLIDISIAGLENANEFLDELFNKKR